MSGIRPGGEPVVIFVMAKAGSWGLDPPVLRSITPAGVLSAQGSRSHTSVVMAWARSARARRSTADTVDAAARRLLSLALGTRAAVARQIIRAR